MSTLWGLILEYWKNESFVPATVRELFFKRQVPLALAFLILDCQGFFHLVWSFFFLHPVTKVPALFLIDYFGYGA